MMRGKQFQLDGGLGRLNILMLAYFSAEGCTSFLMFKTQHMSLRKLIRIMVFLRPSCGKIFKCKCHLIRLHTIVSNSCMKLLWTCIIFLLQFLHSIGNTMDASLRE